MNTVADAPCIQAETNIAWLCIHSQPKHEHIAAANLRSLGDIEVFNPRFRVRRSTKRGMVWVTEPLFPGYLFARFDYRTRLDQVKYTSGVSTIVHFGTRIPAVPDEVVAELKQRFGEAELVVVENDLLPGDEVSFGSGPFQGMQAVVHRLLPAPQRVQVLLDILGRSTLVVVERKFIVPEQRRLVCA